MTRCLAHLPREDLLVAEDALATYAAKKRSGAKKRREWFHDEDGARESEDLAQRAETLLALVRGALEGVTP